jgi:hypothetical protein
MIRYNWQKIFTASFADPDTCLRIMKMLTYNHVPQDYKDPLFKFYIRDFTGESFMVNPELLFFNQHKWSQRDLAIYCAMASIRPYADYVLHRQIHLPLEKCPFDVHEFCDNPKILPVEDDYILFQYEEIPPKRQQH